MKKNSFSEFTKTFIFAISVAAVIHWGIGEPSTVPTDSMENTIMTGDTILISKLHYGPRTPITPLQIPLTHQRTKLLDLKSYSTLIQLPSFRLPGFSKIKRGDIIVFNCLHEKDLPVDMRTIFVKRCVGLPGEMISSVDDEIFVNNEKISNSENVLFHYFITSKIKLGDQWFLKNGIFKCRNHLNGFIAPITKSNSEKIAKLKYISGVEKCYPSIAESIFINKFSNYNTIYTFDPIKIPQRGMEIDVTDPKILNLYFDTIIDDRPNDKIEIIQNKLIINDKEVKKYIFQKDYYFVMGDNRYNSSDSRMWGFVPEDHVCGKAICVMWSIDKNKSGFNHVRWDRWFKSLY